MSSQEESKLSTTDIPGVPLTPPPTPYPIYNGVPIRGSHIIKDILGHIKKVRALQLRDDDVLLSAFPKCGTHWMAEILTMLRNRTSDYAKLTKESGMLELLPDLSVIESHPSPRLLNSHLFFAHLPDQEIIRRKIKIVHVIRNPKDTLVSYYHHRKHFASDNDKITQFDAFVKGYMAREVKPTHQFDFLKQMQEFERAHPDHPIIHVHYEDLKLDPLPVVKNLAEFLGVPATEEFYKQVIDACGFQKLKKNDVGREGTGFDEKLKTMSFYRKGIIGDWKNEFTVAMSEAFDEFIAQQSKDIDITFRGL